MTRLERAVEKLLKDVSEYDEMDRDLPVRNSTTLDEVRDALDAQLLRARNRPKTAKR